MIKTLLFSCIVLLSSFTAQATKANTSSDTSLHDKEVIVLAHGLARGKASMWLLHGRLEYAGYQVCAIDYTTLGATIDEVLSESFNEITACVNGSQKIHFVGHSLGGLVIRHFLTQSDKQAQNIQLGEVVIIGTPNKGSPVADQLEDHFIMSIAGEVGFALMRGKNTLGKTLPPFNTPVGVIAGTKSSPVTNAFFSQPNDGLVSVDSTKVEQMKDVIALPVGHAGMRYSQDVADQVIQFIRQGRFDHSVSTTSETRL